MPNLIHIFLFKHLDDPVPFHTYYFQLWLSERWYKEICNESLMILLSQLKSI